MALSERSDPALAADWLSVCRRAANGVRAALEDHRGAEDRARTTGRGEGGDLALAIDRAAEDAVFSELESLDAPLTAISEERGQVPIAGGGPAHVVVDPIDGSLNAKRRIPFHCLSIAVASGPTMEEVEFGYIAELDGATEGHERWAERGAGAYRDGERLAVVEPTDDSVAIEVLAVEAVDPRVVAATAESLAATGAHRLRALGSIALSLCLVADGRADAMATLGPCRSVDAAAGQLIVLEAGGIAIFPDDRDDDGRTPLDLTMRSRVMAACRRQELDALAKALGDLPKRE